MEWRGETSIQPCIGFQIYLTNNKKGSSQNILLKSCWLFKRFLETFYSKRKKQLTIFTAFNYISYERDIKIFLK